MLPHFLFFKHLCSIFCGSSVEAAAVRRLRRAAAGGVSDVDSDGDGEMAVNEFFRAAALRPATPPAAGAMGQRELWDAFPSWGRGAEKSQPMRGFVCCAWNSACVAADEILKGKGQQVTVYKNPWSLQYQLPLLTLENGDTGNDNSIGADMDEFEKKNKAILEAQRKGAFCETVNYGTEDTFSITLQKFLNNALWEYCLTYLLLCSNNKEDESNNNRATSACNWGSSVFVRNITSTEDTHTGFVTLEVVAIICANDIEEPIQLVTSLFDADDLDNINGNEEEDELCPSTIGISSSSTRTFPLARRRWTAGHLFQLRLSHTKLLLRHDSSHLVVNTNFNSQCKKGIPGSHNYDYLRLFPKHQGRLETLPLPRRMYRRNSSYNPVNPKEDQSTDVFLQDVDLNALVGILCERVEKVDNAVAIHGVVPVVRVSLPFMAPSPRQLWEKLLQKKSSAVAAAGEELVAKAKSRIEKN
ncbi:hypothetical protein LSM04_009676 [Trypanosoma melophagium]|uniref:uncharacterized protein n=1 Tax=Trypanosoma melophagium TaxID=715481 RepID=UPI00351A8A1F|nr:hypothetical protein LSM04_009676 [Trypanosoma melophagium]